MRTAWIAIVLGAACGGGNSSRSTTVKPAPTCAAVADSMVAMMAEGKESTKAFVETKQGFTTIISTRCAEDAWTAEAKQCLATMKSREDAERCSTLLTEQQQANLVRDQKAKFGAGAGADADAEPSEAAPAAAAPPAPAAPAPMEAEKKTEAPKAKRAAPKSTKAQKTGDPCDGGE